MIDRQKVLDFIYENRDTKFYHPVVFIPGIMEIKGKWDKATKQLADIIFSDIEGKSVLDLGCNYGFFLHEAHRRGAKNIVGVDHDAVVIDSARKILDILEYDIELIHEDVIKHNPVKKFDVVLMLNIIHTMNNSYDAIRHFLSHAKEKLIVSCDDENADCLEGLDVVECFQSPRSAGMRKVRYILPTASQNINPRS